MHTAQIKVWDIATRIFHWSLVTLFIAAYASEDDFMNFHATAGYIIGGLIVFRLIWGLIGPHHARFSDFVKSPEEVKRYLKDVLLFRAKRYIGHNPAGGYMVLALIITLIFTTLTGMMAYGATEFAGPFAAWLGTVSKSTAHNLEEVHEFFANFTVLLVLIHVSGVVIASLQHRENLVRSMINGYKDASPQHPETHHKEVTQ